MALSFNLWSRTAASNATADPAVNWAEGQLPSTVNDSARAMMASAAGYRDDVAGAITTGGSATAYTVTSYQVFSTLAAMAGQMIAFVPHATNTNAVGVDCTLNVDGLGAKSIRMQPSIAIPNGTLVLGTPYVATYNNSDAVFYLRAMTNPYSIPLGGGLDFWGSTAPNSSFALPFGQALSRTTYATLFSIFSTTYGVGDGSSTFNIPDLRGRIVAGKDDMGGSAASRLGSIYFGTSAAVLGAVGGGESVTLATPNLPAYTPAGSVAVTASGTVNLPYNAGVGFNAGGSVVPYQLTNPNANTLTAVTVTINSQTFTGTAQGGTSSPVVNVQPTIIANKLVRII